MSNKCCIPNCTGSKPDVHLHAFPRSEKRFRSWLRSINDPALLQLNKNKVISRRRVCRKHFEAKFIRQTPGKGSRFVLTPDACPTLFSAIEIESKIPNRNKLGSNIVVIHLLDHTYNLDSGLEILTSIGVQSEEGNTYISGLSKILHLFILCIIIIIFFYSVLRNLTFSTLSSN